MSIAPDAPVMVDVQNVNKWFGTFHVLKDINFQVRLGEKMIVCGPSGSGKSTMIRCINRLERHDEGRIIVDGIELNEPYVDPDQVTVPDGPQSTWLIPPGEVFVIGDHRNQSADSRIFGLWRPV